MGLELNGLQHVYVSDHDWSRKNVNSQDAVSLFANIPIDKALEVIWSRLEKVGKLRNTKNVTCLGHYGAPQTCAYHNSFFVQWYNILAKFGMVLGSPVVANCSKAFLLFHFSFVIVSVVSYVTFVFCCPYLWSTSNNMLLLQYLNCGNGIWTIFQKSLRKDK